MSKFDIFYWHQTKNYFSFFLLEGIILILSVRNQYFGDYIKHILYNCWSLPLFYKIEHTIFNNSRVNYCRVQFLNIRVVLYIAVSVLFFERGRPVTSARSSGGSPPHVCPLEGEIQISKIEIYSLFVSNTTLLTKLK